MNNRRGGTATETVPASAAPAITLNDAAGFLMALGGERLANQPTGETRQISAASILMLGNDKDHKVIWQAPNY